MRKILLILAILFGLYYVFGFDTIPAETKMVFKLLPMILIILFALSTRIRSPRYYVLVCTGLVFCAIGDYTLQWFIIGLISFLIGHIFYIAAFSEGKEHVPNRVKAILLFYGAFMAIWICSTLSSEIVLAIAVLAYISVILAMGWMSCKTGSLYAKIGALSFILSDSILAVNKFITDIPFSHELIMVTYYSAQIFISLSITQYYEIRNKMVH